MDFSDVVVGVLLLSLFFVVGLLVARIVMGIVMGIGKGKPAASLLPRLVDVAGVSEGVLTCPTCRGASFQCPPAGSRGILAFALGPFIFGSLMGRETDVVECVTCATRFGRGLRTMAPSSLTSSLG